MSESRISTADRWESEGPDLDWLAFQYVAGELPARECEAFELQMAEDQQAREAVARAVKLAGTLAASRPRTLEPASQLPGLSLPWRQLACAACVAALVVLGVSMRLLQKPAAIDEIGLTENPNARTATDWVALWPSEADSDSDDPELSFNETEQPPAIDTPADALAVPSWMVAPLEHDHDDLVEEER